MKNPSSPKERNLLRGAIGRVFSRSELRRKIVELSVVKHKDLSRKRVKNWCFCPLCLNFIPKSYMHVDHIKPVVAIFETLEELTWTEVVDRLWCNENNLMAICKDCHLQKSLIENKARRAYKKDKK